MEVAGKLGDGQAQAGDFVQGEGEKVLVVGFEGHEATGFQDLPVAEQSLSVGEAALGVAGFWPGVAEIKVDAVQLAVSKVITDVGHVGHDKTQIADVKLSGALKASDQHRVKALDADESSVRVSAGSGGEKLSFAAAQLHVKVLCGGRILSLAGLGRKPCKIFAPAASLGGRFSHQPAGCSLHALIKILYFSVSQCGNLPGDDR